jgi:hypothetical protein
MSRRIRFHGVAEFPWKIPVREECLGMLDRIRVGNRSVEIALPINGAGTHETPPGAPLLAPQDYRGQPLAGPAISASTVNWGFRFSANLHYIGAARVSFLLTPASSIYTSPEFLELHQDFLNWFDIVQHWAAAWSGVPLRIGGRQESISLILTKDNRTVGTPILFFPAVTVDLTAKAVPLSRTQLQSAFRRASQGNQLPVEHRLLLSAQVARMAGDRRLAVIEAGSASEVALAAAVSEDLRSRKATIEFINQTIIDANGIVGLMALYMTLGHILSVSKNRVANELARIRNLAVHGGQIPTDSETQNAINHASALVQDARPLPAI